MIKYVAQNIKRHVIKNFCVTYMDSFLNSQIYFQFKFVKIVLLLMNITKLKKLKIKIKNSTFSNFDK